MPIKLCPFLLYKAYKLPGKHASSDSSGHQKVLDCDVRTISETPFLPRHPGNVRTSSVATINVHVNVSRPEEDRNNSTMSDLIDEAPPSSDEAQPPD